MADYFFAVKSIGLSTCGGRKPCSLVTALRHNRRAIQAEQGARRHIDPKRMYLNKRLAGAATPEAVAMLAISSMAFAGVEVDKLRKDYTQAIELLFSLPVGGLNDTTAYFQQCTDWAAKQFGADNILSSDVHYDESAPHCHVLVLPLVAGHMAGSALIAREKTKKLTDSFWKEVAQPTGFKRPPARLKGVARGSLAKLVIEAMQARSYPATVCPTWQATRAAIEANPAPFAASLGIAAPEPTARKRRTLVQVFTSKGKGGKTEKPYQAKPMGIEAALKPIGLATQPAIAPKMANVKPYRDYGLLGIDPEKDQTLSCVGIAFQTAPIRHYKLKPATVSGDYSRTQDADFDVSAWECENFEQHESEQP